MIIRTIEDNDLNSLAELFVTVFNQEPWNENWTVEWVLERVNIIFGSYGFHGVMADDSNMPVGAIFSRMGSYKGELELEIVENFVRSAQQRRGVSEGLMNELKLPVKKEGIRCFKDLMRGVLQYFENEPGT
jgi:aminoglycoside 6'-N-acetyltransferase I